MCSVDWVDMDTLCQEVKLYCSMPLKETNAYQYEEENQQAASDGVESHCVRRKLFTTSSPKRHTKVSFSIAIYYY